MSLLNRIRRWLDISSLHQSLPLVALQLIAIAGLSWYGYTQRLVEMDGLISGAAATLERQINTLVTLCPHLTGALIFVITLLNSFIIVRVIARNLILPERTYLPAIIYFVLCYGVFYPIGELSAMIASYLLTVAVVTLINVVPRVESFGKSFKAGILVGVVPLLHPELAIMVLFIPIAMVMMKRSSREGMIAVAGALLPTITWGYVEWVSGGKFTAVFVDIVGHIYANGIGSAFMELSTSQIVLVALLALATILSLGVFFRSRMKMRTIPHRVLTLMVALMVVVLPMSLISTSLAAALPIVAIPASFIVPLLFVKRQSILNTLLYLLIMAAVVVSTLSLI